MTTTNIGRWSTTAILCAVFLALGSGFLYADPCTPGLTPPPPDFETTPMGVVFEHTDETCFRSSVVVTGSEDYFGDEQVQGSEIYIYTFRIDPSELVMGHGDYLRVFSLRTASSDPLGTDLLNVSVWFDSFDRYRMMVRYSDDSGNTVYVHSSTSQLIESDRIITVEWVVDVDSKTQGDGRVQVSLDTEQIVDVALDNDARLPVEARIGVVKGGTIPSTTLGNLLYRPEGKLMIFGPDQG